MKKSDLAPALRQHLLPLADYPNVSALVPPPPPRRIAIAGVSLARASEALGKLAAISKQLPAPALITRTLARREAVFSSQIEGTQSDIDQLLAYEATESEEGLPPDVRITQNYVEALSAGERLIRKEGGRAAITIDLIKRLHVALMANVPYRGVAGEFRDRQVWIGGAGRIEDATLVPPPVSAISQCMQELEQGMLQYKPAEDESFEMSLIVQVAIAHAQFETIHPFMDGNGRVGRLLMTLMLASEGYPPLYLSGYLLRKKKEYYRCLKQCQLQGEWAAWCQFMADAIAESASEAEAIARDLLNIRDSWDPRVAHLRSDSAARRLAPLLIGYPVISVTHACFLLGSTFRAANLGIEALVEIGILERVGEAQRGRIFRASEVVERLRRS